MLITFAGLPGTGKTTIARGLGAFYLRADSIEQEIRDSGVVPAAMRVVIFPGVDLEATTFAMSRYPVVKSSLLRL